VAAGDAAPEHPGGGRLTSRAAYLLAFHAAQDAASHSRMLIAAARLERLGDRDLARRLRHVASTMRDRLDRDPRGD
jgi:hypothetical protein